MMQSSVIQSRYAKITVAFCSVRAVPEGLVAVRR